MESLLGLREGGLARGKSLHCCSPTVGRDIWACRSERGEGGMCVAGGGCVWRGGGGCVWRGGGVRGMCVAGGGDVCGGGGEG